MYLGNLWGKWATSQGSLQHCFTVPMVEKSVLICQILQPSDYLGGPLLNSLQFINLSWGQNRTNAKWRHVITSFNCLAMILLNSSRCSCLFLLPGYIAGSCLTSYLLRFPSGSFQLSCCIASQSLPCNAARVYYYPRCKTSHLSLMKLPGEFSSGIFWLPLVILTCPLHIGVNLMEVWWQCSSQIRFFGFSSSLLLLHPFW